MPSANAFFDAPEALGSQWADLFASTIPEIPRDEVKEATVALAKALQLATRDAPPEDAHDEEDLRYLVEDFTRSWREAGVTTRQMSRFLRGVSRIAVGNHPEVSAESVLRLNDWIDDMVLWSLEARLDRLATIVEQQREEMDELSTPFIELYRGVAVLPLVGTLDSERAERVMETLLQGIADNNTRIIVLDITGVPAVDAFVAGRLVKTVEAARLMGAHCILSGLGPGIALTMVRVGVDLSLVETTAQLSDALERAFKRLGLRIVAAE